MLSPRRFRFKSCIENISPIQKQILSMAEGMGFSDDALFCLRLALDESMANAVVHGNRLDKSKEVRVEVHTRDDEIIVTVEDEGCGFNFNCLEDPRNEKNLQKPNGRGIFLIREFAKCVRFNPKGNQITFVIHRQSTYSMVES